MLRKITTEALPLRGKIGQWMANQTEENGLCPLCRINTEATSHLFLSCPWRTVIWCTGPWPVNTEPFKDLPISEWIKFLLDSRHLPNGQRESWKDVMLAVA